MSGWRVGRRYPIAREKLSGVAHIIPEKVDTRRGTRYQGGTRWRVWTETGKAVDIEIVTGKGYNITVGNGPDPQLPPVLR